MPSPDANLETANVNSVVHKWGYLARHPSAMGCVTTRLTLPVLVPPGASRVIATGADSSAENSGRVQHSLGSFRSALLRPMKTRNQARVIRRLPDWGEPTRNSAHDSRVFLPEPRRTGPPGQLQGRREESTQPAGSSAQIGIKELGHFPV
jgi:hypothetical protein